MYVIEALLLLSATGAVALWVVYLYARHIQQRVAAAVVDVHQQYGRLVLGESDVNTLKSRICELNETAIRELQESVR